MFQPCPQPPSLSQASLRSFRVSINAPQVSTGDGPPGPARAAIVLHAQQEGGFGLTILLRPLDDGGPSAFAYRGPISDEGLIPPLLEEAQAFGEDLGFVFDDDMIDMKKRTGRDKAIACWREMVRPGRLAESLQVAGESPAQPLGEDIGPDDDSLVPRMQDLLPDPGSELDPPSGTRAAPAARARRGGDGELLLEEMMDLSGEGDDEIVLETDDLNEISLDEELAGSTMELTGGRGAPGSDAERGDAGESSGVGLSKFRKGDGGGATKKKSAAAPAEDARRTKSAAKADKPERRKGSDRRKPAAGDENAAAGGQELGRIAIVRRRADGEPDTSGPLARLLGSF